MDKLLKLSNVAVSLKIRATNWLKWRRAEGDDDPDELYFVTRAGQIWKHGQNKTPSPEPKLTFHASWLEATDYTEIESRLKDGFNNPPKVRYSLLVSF